jgi:hypothetical protein
METSFPSLPPEIEAVVVAQHGGPVSVSGEQGEHVVMSMATYRDLLGVGSEEEFLRSVADLQVSIAQAEAGETMSLDEVRQKLTDKYGASRTTTFARM